MANRMTFEDWMKAVDREISDKIGLTSDDLPDICYRDMYDDGDSAKTVAKRAIRNAGE
jgi:hypothetical protein